MDIASFGIGVAWAGFFFAALSNLWLAICILWAPFAAGISAKQAHAKGSDIWWYYGLVGALYSVFLFLPWLYLVSRLAGRALSVKVIATGYCFVYIYWLASLSFNTLFLIDQSPPTEILFAFCCSVTAAVVSAMILLRGFRERNPQDSLQSFAGYYQHRYRDFVHVLPFVCATLQTIVLDWSIISAVFS